MENRKIIAMWNGHIMPLEQVSVSPLDRGYVFGDGVYEVLRIYNGCPFLLDAHMSRLEQSLEKMSLPPLSGLYADILSVIGHNEIEEGMVYLQVTRGTAPRVHSYSNLALKPNVLIYGKHFPEHPSAQDAKSGIKAISLPDLRWGRCDIKSLNLLGNCMAITLANERGALEALQFRDGFLTEGTSSNVFVVKNEAFLTPPLSNHILPGTRRNYLVEKLRLRNSMVREAPISQQDVNSADEIFITSSIREATAVISLDAKQVGSGRVGPMAKLARDLIMKGIEEQCGVLIG
jgi:D-alanine transaminase